MRHNDLLGGAPYRGRLANDGDAALLKLDGRTIVAIDMRDGDGIAVGRPDGVAFAWKPTSSELCRTPVTPSWKARLLSCQGVARRCVSHELRAVRIERRGHHSVRGGDSGSTPVDCQPIRRGLGQGKIFYVDEIAGPSRHPSRPPCAFHRGTGRDSPHRSYSRAGFPHRRANRSAAEQHRGRTGKQNRNA